MVRREISDDELGLAWIEYEATVQLGTLVVPTPVTAGVETDSYRVALTIELEQRRPVCTAIRRLSGGTPLTGELLRSIPLQRIIQRVQEHVRQQLVERDPLGASRPSWDTVLPKDAPHDLWIEYPASRETIERELSADSPGGPKRVSDELLREAADVYREALATGQSNPTEVVRKRLHLARSTAGRYVGKARERGFLGPAMPRRAGERATVPE